MLIQVVKIKLWWVLPTFYYFIMVTKEEIEKIAREENKTFLKISRLPTHYKNIFVQIAEEDFCGDYGMLQREMIISYLEYQKVKDVLLDKEFLTYILESLPKSEQQVEQIENKPQRKTFADMRIESKGGNE